MTFRKVLFWLHLITGTIAGIVILIMSITGVVLMYEKQIIRWTDRGYRSGPPSSGAARLPVETLLAKVREQRHALPESITLREDLKAPAELSFGRGRTVFMNPYTGELLGEGSKGIRTFFQQVTAWHRWLGASGEGRAAARAITGACNLAFLFLVISGFYLWFPRKWAWQHLKPITWFRGGLSGKARDFNWHNVIGLWCAIPLFFVVLTAVVMSYPWANNLLYRMTGNEPPAQGRGPGAGGPPGGAPQRREGARGEGQRAERRREGGRTPSGEGRERRQRSREASHEGEPSAGEVNFAGLNRLWVRAEQEASGWKSISMRVPTSADAPVTFSIDRGNGTQPEKRAQLTLNAKTAEVVSRETFSSYNWGRRLRFLFRFIHTGEEFGFIGQTIAGVASAGGVMLVWTGLALAWRRLRGWQARRQSAKERALAVTES